MKINNMDFDKQTMDSEVIDTVSRLIASRSYSGEEQGVVRIMGDYLKENGFGEVIIDRLGNCILHLKGSRPGRSVVFDAHMDTVPVMDSDLEKWESDPFKTEIRNGRIYGRGTADMKGSLGAMMVALKYFAKAYGNDFSGDIYVCGIVHEECFEGVAAREISKAYKPDYVVIGEASDLNIKVGQRGRAEIVVKTYGVPAHSSNPGEGVNAVYSMLKVADRIHRMPVAKHHFLADGILELTDIISSPYPGKSVVPTVCTATYDRRLLPGETIESVLAPINEIIDELSADDTTFKAETFIASGHETCYTNESIDGVRFFPGWSYDEDLSYIDDVMASIREAGYDPEITKYDFCTNGSHYAGEAGIKCFGIGPGSEKDAHTINESVPVAELTGACECYVKIMEALNK